MVEREWDFKTEGPICHSLNIHVTPLMLELQISFPLLPTVLGHTASKKEEVDQKKSGWAAKQSLLKVQSSREGRGLEKVAT